MIGFALGVIGALHPILFIATLGLLLISLTALWVLLVAIPAVFNWVIAEIQLWRK